MKKNSFFKMAVLISLFTGGALFGVTAQVTVGGNSAPRATLDVVAIPDYTEAQGVIAPNLAISVLDANQAAYAKAQTGAIVYVDDVTGGSQHAKTVNITQIGYFYFDGNVWQGMGSGGNCAPPLPKIITGSFTGTTRINLDATDFSDCQHLIAIHTGPGGAPNVLIPDLTAGDFGKIFTFYHKGAVALQASYTGVVQSNGGPSNTQENVWSASLGPNKARTMMWIGNMWIEISF